MDKALVRKILARIESGNQVFNTLTPESANALGVPTEEDFTDQELSWLRPCLDDLARQGYIQIEFRSLANSYTVHMTAQGAALLRQLGG